jgi:hypothetical protein
MASFSRTTTRPRHSRIQFGVALLAGFACLTSPALADRSISPSKTAEALPQPHLTAFAEQQPAPTNTHWSLYSPHEEELRLKARQKDDDDDDAKSSKDEDKDDDKKSSKDDDAEDDETKAGDKTKTVTVDDKTTVTEEDSSPARTSTMELSVTVSEPTGSPSPLPAAFDGNIASEFKSTDEDDSCPNFIENLLGSSEFQRCYPFSMLVQVRRTRMSV